MRDDPYRIWLYAASNRTGRRLGMVRLARACYPTTRTFADGDVKLRRRTGVACLHITGSNARTFRDRVTGYGLMATDAGAHLVTLDASPGAIRA